MKGDKTTISTYRVTYTNKIGKRVTKNVRALTASNARIFTARKTGGKNVTAIKIR